MTTRHVWTADEVWAELEEAERDLVAAQSVNAQQERLIKSLEAAVDRLRLDLDEVRAERDVLAGEVLP